MRLHFDWDPAKAASNAAKHGVTFQEAMTVFLDPFVSTIPNQITILFVIPGRPGRAEPGIHTPGPWFWIPGSGLRRPRNDGDKL
jgi:hypothetical protein